MGSCAESIPAACTAAGHGRSHGHRRPTPAGRHAAGLLLIVSALLTACDIAGDVARTPPDSIPDGPAHMPGDPPPPVNNRFDAGQLSVGDEVLGLRVSRIAVRPATPPDSGYLGEVAFAGNVTLSGRYRAHPEYPGEGANYMCFFVDSETAARLPRFEADERLPWLCFTNRDFTIAELGPLDTEGGATVVVDEYRTIRQRTNAFDTALLVSVITRNVLEEE